MAAVGQQMIETARHSEQARRADAISREELGAARAKVATLSQRAETNGHFLPGPGELPPDWTSYSG